MLPSCARRFTEKFTQAATLEEGLKRIQDMGPIFVGATLGGDGCIACCDGQLHYAGAFDVDTIDTTGAGDIFHGGIVYGLLNRWPIEKILAFANAAGALTTTHVGVQTHIPKLDAITALLSAK